MMYLDKMSRKTKVFKIGCFKLQAVLPVLIAVFLLVWFSLSYSSQLRKNNDPRSSRFKHLVVSSNLTSGDTSSLPKKN